MSAFDAVLRQPKHKKKDELWLISYADLVTNLMAIFVMMLAISSVDMAKFDSITSRITQDKEKQRNTLEELKKKLDAEIIARKIQQKVRTELTMTGLHVEFLSGVLFESASADLSFDALKEAMPILDILSKTDKKYFLSFEGHTDDVPVKKSGKFRDNWDLSSARGVALLTKIKELGVPEVRMAVGGYAHTRPKVEYKNKLGKELDAARGENRRVVIRVFQ